MRPFDHGHDRQQLWPLAIDPNAPINDNNVVIAPIIDNNPFQCNLLLNKPFYYWII